MYEKLGAHIESTSVGRHAEINSPARPFNQEELKKLQEQLQAFYDQFVEKVADSRHSTPEQIDALAQGRVWTGRQAKQNHLVDELGGLDRAIAIAKQRAKLPADGDVEIVVYPPKRSFYEVLTDQLSGTSEAAGSAALSAWLAANLSSPEVDALRTMRGSTPSMALRGSATGSAFSGVAGVAAVSRAEAAAPVPSPPAVGTPMVTWAASPRLSVCTVCSEWCTR